jgi:hypothetical protein
LRKLWKKNSTILGLLHYEDVNSTDICLKNVAASDDTNNVCKISEAFKAAEFDINFSGRVSWLKMMSHQTLMMGTEISPERYVIFNQ